MKFALLVCLIVLAGQARAESESASSGWFSRFFPARANPSSQVLVPTAFLSALKTNDATKFEDPLPQDETNRLIYDTLTQRILVDAAEQVKVQPEVEAIPELEADEKMMADQASPKSEIPIMEALRIVQSSGLSDCVRRVICQLSCNANAFGVQGRRVFKNLIKLQMNKTIQEDTTSFKVASQKGLQLKQSKFSCDRCLPAFPDCKSESSDLVAVSAMFDV